MRLLHVPADWPHKYLSEEEQTMLRRIHTATREAAIAVLSLALNRRLRRCSLEGDALNEVCERMTDGSVRSAHHLRTDAAILAGALDLEAEEHLIVDPDKLIVVEHVLTGVLPELDRETLDRLVHASFGKAIDRGGLLLRVTSLARHLLEGGAMEQASVRNLFR